MERLTLALTDPEYRLRNVLRCFVALFAFAGLIYGLGPFLGPFTEFMRILPFAALSVPKVISLGLVCLYGAGDPRRQIGLAWIVVAGHAISILAMVFTLMFGDVAATVQMGNQLTPVATLLRGAIILDGVILVLLLVFTAGAASAGREATQVATTYRRPPDLATETAALRVALFSITVICVLLATAVLLAIAAPLTQSAFVQLPFVTNVVVLYSTLAMVCAYIAMDIRHRIGVVAVPAWTLVVSALAQFSFALAAGSEPPVVVGPLTFEARNLLLIGGTAHSIVATILFLLREGAYHQIYHPAFLSTRGYRTLIAAADVLVHGPNESIAASKIAANVDQYFGNMRSKRRWVHRAALLAVHLHPVLYLMPPLSEIDPSSRSDHLKRHFFHEVAIKIIPNFFRQQVSGIIRVVKQLAYVGYYNDADADAAVGYVRFEDRARVAGKVPPKRPPLDLKVTTPENVDSLHVETEICVIGSGAAGAILTYRLAEAGHDVLLVERGRYVEPRHFRPDEVAMVGQLYDDGVFQQTRDLRFTILQGSCLGGSTVVNNAVCFPPPPEVVANWNDRFRWDAGVNVAEFENAVQTAKAFMNMKVQSTAHLNPSSQEWNQGIAALGLPVNELNNQIVTANIADNCPGCGYCNIGCAYGFKLSMLDTVIPAAQKNFGDRVRIFAEAPVEKILTGKRGPKGARVNIVRARLADGRALTIRAKKVVVAAGAISSSYILLSSGIGKGLPVGNGMSFNMGAPLTAEFDREMNAYDGLQISHAALPRKGRGWVFETWFNPPVAQALNMPGWFEQHYNNMLRYPHMMAVGALVGTASNGRVRRALTGGPDVIYEPTPEDRGKLADALIELGRVLFAGGARRVMVNSWNYHEFRSPHALSDITRLMSDPEEMLLGSGHPQGGNAMSKDPQWGVVGPDFRVHGYENLFICDASVIPSSLTVNPQHTVMSLAHYAAPRISEARP